MQIYELQTFASIGVLRGSLSQHPEFRLTNVPGLEAQMRNFGMSQDLRGKGYAPTKNS